MNGVTLRILKAVAKRGELSLSDALRLAKAQHKSHLDQYPLALLLEENYLGMTLNHVPPQGAESMREFTLATTLHMFRSGRGSDQRNPLISDDKQVKFPPYGLLEGHLPGRNRCSKEESDARARTA
jgi:hypothetical protein